MRQDWPKVYGDVVSLNTPEVLEALADLPGPRSRETGAGIGTRAQGRKLYYIEASSCIRAPDICRDWAAQNGK